MRGRDAAHEHTDPATLATEAARRAIDRNDATALRRALIGWLKAICEEEPTQVGM